MEKILLLKDASNLLLRKLKEFIDKIENVETKKKHFLLDHSRAGNFEEDRFKEWMAHNLKTEVLDLNDDIKSIITK